MFELKNIVRKNILELKPYSSARDEFSGSDGVFLDANENPFGALNRYPDPYQKDLKQKLSVIKSIATENIFIGNGSDEVIDLAFRIFCKPGKDKALTFTPSYGMYEVSADINEVELIKIPLDDTFQIDFNSIKTYFLDEKLKLLFICSPNNPTGNTINHIELILQQFDGIVMVDEAYIDFSRNESLISKIKMYPNLIVAQTFSKAWGLAAVRVGVAYADDKIINLFNKVKAPYNVSELNQKAVLKVMDNISDFEKVLAIILEQKLCLEKALKSVKVIKKVYSSDANFILVETENAEHIYNQLVAQKVITRNRHSLVKNCIRITVGTPEENQKLLNALNKI
ncbi:MAG: histidinol-phosphate transaminase [Saprospiraceae bacterium]|nr:histidinol-phosphate transaminase [Saprospiraceae bacterium]